MQRVEYVLKVQERVNVVQKLFFFFFQDAVSSTSNHQLTKKNKNVMARSLNSQQNP